MVKNLENYQLFIKIKVDKKLTFASVCITHQKYFCTKCISSCILDTFVVLNVSRYKYIIFLLRKIRPPLYS